MSRLVLFFLASCAVASLPEDQDAGKDAAPIADAPAWSSTPYDAPPDAAWPPNQPSRGGPSNPRVR